MAIDEMDVPTQLATTVFANTANNVSGVLSAACAATDTSLSLTPGGGALFPNAPFYCSCEFEVMWCLAKSGDSLVVQRGMDGTTAAAHAVANLVEMRNNAGLWTDLGHAVNNLETGVASGSALPANLAYVDKVQEFTNKTIDLTTPAKGNVIIGTVQPDPAALVYQNILPNGGFDEWYGNKSLTIAAGSPTSGPKNIWLTNYWWIGTTNDSSITASRDNTHLDPAGSSGYNMLLNITTVQANDYSRIFQSPDNDTWDWAYYRKFQGQACSASVKANLVSGTMQMQICMSYWDSTGQHDLLGPWVPLTNGYATYKLENQVWIPNGTVSNVIFVLNFKGAGQVAIDSVMVVPSPVASNYRSNPHPMLVGVKNMMVNGGMEIWSRGDGPFNNNGVYTADRWSAGFSGTTSVNISKVANYGKGRWCLQYNINNISGAAVVTQEFRADEYARVNGRFITITAEVLCTVPNVLQMDVYDGTNDPRSDFHNGSGWQTLTVSHYVPQVDASTGFLQVRFLIIGNGTFYIDNVMMAIGQEPATFTPMSPEEDLLNCSRFYEKNDGSNNMIRVMGQSPAGVGVPADTMLYYKARKCVVPTVTIYGAWSAANTSNPVMAGNASIDMLVLEIMSTASGQYFFASSANGSGVIVEANP